MEKEFKRDWTWVSSGAGTGSRELSLNLKLPHGDVWEGEGGL